MGGIQFPKRFVPVMGSPAKVHFPYSNGLGGHAGDQRYGIPAVYDGFPVEKSLLAVYIRQQ